MQKTKRTAKKCCGGCKGRKKKNGFNPEEIIETSYDYLLRGTYVFCSCLILYSLLVLNGLAASDSELRGKNLVAEATKPVVVAMADIWYDTAFFMEDYSNYTADLMGESIRDTIALYGNSIASVFKTTGDTLAMVPEVINWAPTVMAKNSNNYW